ERTVLDALGEQEVGFVVEPPESLSTSRQGPIPHIVQLLQQPANGGELLDQTLARRSASRQGLLPPTLQTLGAAVGGEMTGGVRARGGRVIEEGLGRLGRPLCRLHAGEPAQRLLNELAVAGPERCRERDPADPVARRRYVPHAQGAHLPGS